MELSGAGSPPRALCCRLGAATELQDGVFQGQKCSQGHTGAQLSRSPGPARFCSWHACPAPQGSCLPARGAARPARPAWTPAPRGFLANSQGFETLGNSFLLQPWTLGSSWSLRDPGQGNTGTPPGVGVLGTSSSTNRDTLPNTVLAGSGMAELEGHSAGCPRGDSSPVPWEQEQSWAPLLGSSPGDRSSSSSICTEDFAARFQEGMVLPEEEEDELTGIVPAEGADPGQDESSFPTGRSLDVQRQLGTDPGRKLWEDRSPSLMRRGSLESLGARISQLSQSHVLGGAWGEPCPAPSAQPALGQGDPLQGGPGSREALLAFALPGHPLRTPGISAGRSRAGARTGSASLPGASSARTRGHPSSKALGQRLQEPPALRGQSRGNVTLAVDDTEREGAGSRSRAPCSDHRAEAAPGAPGAPGALGALGAPGRCGAGTRVSPVSWRQRGKHKVGLPCQGAVALPVSLQRSREGTREPGSGAKTRSGGDRARAGLALLPHTWDSWHRNPTDRERMSRQGEGACAGCRERLGKEERKMLALQEEKLELLKRLRELEQSSRSLLQQRLETLQQLHRLLLREKVDTLQQLQRTLEQESAGRSARLEHLPGHPREPAVRGRAGHPPAMEISSLSPCQHQPLPSSALGRGPSPAAGGHALHILRGLREHIQRRLRDWQRVEGALGPAGQRKKSEHLHPTPTLSLSLSSVPLAQPWVPRAPAPSPEPLAGAAAGEDTARGEPECPGGELGSTAREEVQRQPGDSPCATTSAQGWIQTRRSCRAPLRIMPRTDLPGGNGPATGLGHRGLCLTWRPRAGPTTTSNLCHGISDTRVVR
ncbi:uncharacterized protein LOC135423890 isoform X2 [Pseudopipra pipra]|uniref:uncharacterized protein LOC135423890 isoform X2 n=1 Tax=Pseudopipra pipra TaxID=415032 RepID=UPI003138F26D